jgi:hypothetical protein
MVTDRKWQGFVIENVRTEKEEISEQNNFNILS